MSRPQRSKEEILAVKRNIVEKSIQLFVREGIESLSARKIGKEVGMTAANLYNYFENMEEIVFEIQEYCLDKFLKFIEGQYKDTSDVKENMKSIFKLYISFGIQNPDMYGMLFGNNLEVFLNNKKKDAADKIVITPDYIIDNIQKMNSQADSMLHDVVYQLYVIAHGVVDSYNSGIVKHLVTDSEKFIDEFIDKIIGFYSL